MILVCGSRTWTDEQRVRDVLDTLMITTPEGLVIIDGSAEGPDTFAAKWAEDGNATHRGFPADWKAHGKSAGFKRNLQMLDERPDLVLAFWDGKSRGTKYTIDEAVKRGIKVEVLR